MRKKQLLKAGFSILLASAMMLTSVPPTVQAAPEGVADTVQQAGVESLEAGYYLTVYSKTTQSYAPENTATASKLAQEAQSVYMAVSTDGKNFEVLNSGGGVIFSKNPNDGCSLKVKDPRVYKDESGFTVEAPDSEASGKIHIFTSKDGVHYYDDTIAASSERSAEPLDKTKFTLMLKGENLLETDSTITLGNALALTEQEYKYIVDKLGTVVNTGLESLKDLTVMTTESVTQQTLESRYPSVNATYSDGSTQKFNIDWTDALKNVDLTKPGEYPVRGRVMQTQYLNNLKALNNSQLPEDDPTNTDPGYPDNVDPEGKVVYYDKTKFIEGMADPFIYWDKVTRKYYMTSSYFPEESDADRLEGDVPEQYDRVVLRCGETLEDLQKRENQITIWKVGNQGYEDNGVEAPRGYRYIWAPEIHRIGNNWVVYFTESQSTNEYNIYCHALILDGNTDPYTTGLETADQPSDWEDHKMRVHEDHAAEVAETPIGDPFGRSFCLDMTYFKDEKNNKSYVSWAGKPTAAYQGGNTDLFIATVDENEPWKITSPATRLTCPEYGWERISYCVNEGSTVLQHDGNIFLCYSASGTGSEYSIGMLSAKNGEDLLDISNWTKSPYPLLSSRDVNGEEGPGHNSFTTDKDGNAIFVYHARPTSHNYGLCGYGDNPLNDPCRHARLKRVHWAADGTPILKMTYEDELKEENKIVSLKIKVQAPPSIRLNKTTLALEAGKNATLNVSAGSAGTVTWSSNAPKVATVANGRVTAKKAGTATITATAANGMKATCTVTVVSLSKTKLTMKIGESAALKVNGTKKKVTWASSKKGNVSVANGKLSAKKPGTVTVTAKAEGVNLKCTVTVKKAPTKVKATVNGKTKVTLKKNKTCQIKVSMTPKGSDSVLKYSTSNKKVATVDSKGKIKAKNKGTATITVKAANGKNATIKVTVK